MFGKLNKPTNINTGHVQAALLLMLILQICCPTVVHAYLYSHRYIHAPSKNVSTQIDFPNRLPNLRGRIDHNWRPGRLETRHLHMYPFQDMMVQ